MKLSEAEVGRKVVYTPRHGAKEDGVITSKNDRFVSVRYGNDVHSKATNPEDIEYINE